MSKENYLLYLQECPKHGGHYEKGSCILCFTESRQEKILEVLNFYANQLLDYNEVVSQELLADKGQKARDLLELLAEKSKS